MKIKIILFILLISLSASSQKTVSEITETKDSFLDLSNLVSSQKDKIPFASIRILDSRFDSSKVGYVIRKINHEKLKLKGGTASALSTFLNTYYEKILDTASGRELLIVIKKLWLQYGSTNQMLRFGDLDRKSKNNYFDYNTICLADMDVFAGSANTYQALTRITHHFVLDETGSINDAHTLLLPFDSLVRKIQSMNTEASISSRRQISLNEIMTTYNKRFEIPVLLQPEFKKGIFLTFEDFKNNTPAHPDFTAQPGKLSFDIFILENGERKILTEYWGFCDGSDFYIKPGLLPFKITRQGNTFDLLGSLRGDVNAGTYQLGTGYTPRLNFAKSKSYIPITPLQVDMQTGKVY